MPRKRQSKIWRDQFSRLRCRMCNEFLATRSEADIHLIMHYIEEMKEIMEKIYRHGIYTASD